MQKLFFCFSAVFFSTCTLISVYGQEIHSIKLPAPQTTGGKPLMQALAARQSLREFSSQEIAEQVLSNLLWAAFGVNRKESGKRTAPSAANWQEIDICVATAKGVYLYDAKANLLKHVLEEDIRPATGHQPFVNKAPLIIIYVADYSRMRGAEAQKDFYSAVDTGFISQNVYLFCASEGLSTVVLGSVDKNALAEKLNLKPEQKIILTQPVGYPATGN